MKTRNRLFATLAWFQLGISLMLATVIIWGYSNYQASIGQFISSIAASVGAVSAVVIRTAETVEARQGMIAETQKLLVVTRQQLVELKGIAENQVKALPQYAVSLKSAGSALGKVAAPLQNIGEKLMGVSIPGIQMVGIKPVVNFTKPFEDQGKQLKESAEQIKAVGVQLVGISDTIGQDGEKLGSAFVSVTDQSVKVIDEMEKTVTRLKAQDLPKAIADLKTTSENLRNVSTQIEKVSSVGLVLLIVGLLLALWCFVHSLGALLLARSHAVGRDTDTTPAISNA